MNGEYITKTNLTSLTHIVVCPNPWPVFSTINVEVFLCLMVWCGWWLFVVLILVLSLNFLLIISTLPNLCCLCRTKQTTNVFQYSTIILSEGLCLYWVPIKCLYVPDRLYILTVVYLRYNGEIIKKLLLVYALFIPTLDGIQYSIYVCVIQCFCA